MSSSINLGNWNITTVIGDTPIDVVTAKQTHGNVLVSVSECENKVTVADGLIGKKGDKPFGIRTADCMPLVLTTDEHIYALHISRKTLIKGILEETLKLLGSVKIKEVYIGPHICENCFTFSTKGEEIQTFENMFPYAVQTTKGVTHLSLSSVVMYFLEKHGVPQQNIIPDTQCTFECVELPSYKRWLSEGKIGALQNITTIIV